MSGLKGAPTIRSPLGAVVDAIPHVGQARSVT